MFAESKTIRRFKICALVLEMPKPKIEKISNFDLKSNRKIFLLNPILIKFGPF